MPPTGTTSDQTCQVDLSACVVGEIHLDCVRWIGLKRMRTTMGRTTLAAFSPLLLCALVVAYVLTVASAAHAEGPAEPEGDGAGEELPVGEAVATDAITVHDTCRYLRTESLVAGAVTWAMLALVLWLLSVYWVRLPWSQWVILLVFPALVGTFTGAMRVASLIPMLAEIPADELKKISSDPATSTMPGAAEAATLVLKLKNGAETGSLVGTTVVNVTALSGLGTLAIAALGTGVVWAVPRRRRRYSEAPVTQAPGAS